MYLFQKCWNNHKIIRNYLAKQTHCNKTANFLQKITCVYRCNRKKNVFIYSFLLTILTLSSRLDDMNGLLNINMYTFTFKILFLA